MPNGRPDLTRIQPSVDAEEAAAAVAAIERFMRATAVPAQRGGERLDRWRRAALLEGVERKPQQEIADPWINT